jgi:poly-beta-1,6 N-acetyl-D-glucosamine synthase
MQTEANPSSYSYRPSTPRGQSDGASGLAMPAPESLRPGAGFTGTYPQQPYAEQPFAARTYDDQAHDDQAYDDQAYDYPVPSYEAGYGAPGSGASGGGAGSGSGGIERIAFTPIKREEDDHITEEDRGRLYLKRILIYGVASLVLFGIIWLFMEDPFGLLNRVFGYEPRLSWSGLVVYSSIVALILFLFVLLFRYFVLLFLAHAQHKRHTKVIEVDRDFLPPISILVPAYNEGILLKGTVESLLALDYPDYEIVLIDDGSKDDTRAVARELVGTYLSQNRSVVVKLVEKPNGGKSTALNAGIQVAEHELLLCVDGDSQLAEETLKAVVQHMRDPEVGAVAGNVKVANRNNIWTKLQALEYVEGLNFARSAQSALQLVNIIPGPVGLFRKQALFDAGLYASDTYAEDCDVTHKIIRAGWRVNYEPEAISYTEAPEKLTDLLKQRYRWTRGIIQAIRKHRDLFFKPTGGDLSGFTVMWLMAFESLIWPAMNVFANVYFVGIALLFGLNYYLIFWWVSLTILDIVTALYAVAAEREEVRLVPYSILYRLFFILIVDVCKVLATIEEFIGIGMTWGKLDRTGTAAKPAAA